MTSIEHRQLKGITIKNIFITIASTASIVATVMGSFYQLKNDLHEMSLQQDAQNRITDIRLKVLEGQVAILQRQIDQINAAPGR
ncbi:hypothetical protein ACFQZX_03970 [Mucilaginibacter litoreus]|uniref:Four helix bundle sensory module for signal transduction n=1 Tax=Mucilaginibacter litoreus TaxID=1048221 RepID=A0ABW3AP56_9SPHI